MSNARESADTWSELVTRNNVGRFPSRHGFLVPIRGLVRPVEFDLSGIHELYVVVCDEGMKLGGVDIAYIPGVEPFVRFGRNVPGGQLAAISQDGADAVDIVRINDGQQGGDYPVTEVRYGSHPDNGGKKRFYIGAECVGTAALDLSKVTYRQPGEETFEYFPVEPAAGRQPL